MRRPCASWSNCEARHRFSLDDFGTGYSSLNYLRRLPVNTIKIDRSFVITLHRRSTAATIVHAIVNIGCALGKKVVAEGVETEAEHRSWPRPACMPLQGYLFRQADDRGAAVGVAAPGGACTRQGL